MKNSWRDWLEEGIGQYISYLEYAGPKLEYYRAELFYQSDQKCVLLTCWQTKNEIGEYYTVAEEYKVQPDTEIMEKIKNYKVDEPTIPFLHFLQTKNRNERIKTFYNNFFQDHKFIKRELLWPVNPLEIICS